MLGHLGKRNQPQIKINVSSCKFIVTLHGLAPNPETRRDAENAAKEVSGVRGVINKLRVKQDGGRRCFPRAVLGYQVV